MAIKSIAANKVRSFLTMLGVIIGVSAVITLVALGNGATKSITDNIQSLGTNMITISMGGRGSNRGVSEDDLMKFADKNKEIIEAVAPSINSNVTVKVGNENIDTTLVGTSEAFSTVRNTSVQNGRFINVLDVEKRQKVVLLGTYVSNELFPDSNPIGQRIKINGEIYTVVGVLEEKDDSTEQSQDDQVIIPYTTATRLVKNATISTFYVQAKTEDTVDAAMEKLDEMLLEEFKSEDAYRVFNQAAMLETITTTTQTLSMMLGGIAAISLIVGGIGIMNIMLVSVTERTREIGIRKSIGAKRKNILVQFLIESIVISCLGGIIGILLGIGFSSLLGSLLRIPASPSVSTVILSFSFSAMVGIFFGFYPANKASKLNPIDALRHE